MSTQLLYVIEPHGTRCAKATLHGSIKQDRSVAVLHVLDRKMVQPQEYVLTLKKNDTSTNITANPLWARTVAVTSTSPH